MAVGDLLMVAPGEVVPVDGTVATTSAVLDESALTGESLPVECAPGEAVRSGALNAGGPFDLRTTTRAADSAYAGIIRLVSQAQSEPAPFVRLADRYALWFLAVTLIAAGAAWAAAGSSRAVAVLVVATPCPLVLAAPVAFVAGLSLSARRGVVVKGGGVLERLARCTTLLLDKTGTLTSGRPVLAATIPAGSLPAKAVLTYAASLDQVSPHVLAGAIVRAATERGCDLVLPTDVQEVAGRGVRGVVDGHRVTVGKAAWVGVTDAPPWLRAARRKARLDGALTVFVGVDDEPAGVLVLNDPIRSDAGRTLRTLRRAGINRIVMVTGDRAEVAETVGTYIGVDTVLAERSPDEKLEEVRLERLRAPTVMVGDGVNDAPALALADVGVAMGARGATASSEAADAVLTVDRIDRLGETRVIAARTRRIALQSVLVGMAMSLAAMGVAAVGLLPAVWGALLQEGIDVAVIVNALRVLRTRPSEVWTAGPRGPAGHPRRRRDEGRREPVSLLSAIGVRDGSRHVRRRRPHSRLSEDHAHHDVPPAHPALRRKDRPSHRGGHRFRCRDRGARGAGGRRRRRALPQLGGGRAADRRARRGRGPQGVRRAGRHRRLGAGHADGRRGVGPLRAARRGRQQRG